MYFCVRLTKSLIFFTLLWLLAAPAFVFSQARPENSNKLGGMFSYYLGTTIIFDNVENGNRGVKKTPMNGFGAYYEWIASSFFGYELRGSIVQQQTVTEIDSVESTIGNSSQYFGGSFRAYTQSHKRTGNNYYGAVNVGVMNTTLEVVSGPPDTLQGKSYNMQLLIYGFEAGVDYILKAAGIRSSLGYQFGQQTAQPKEGEVYRVNYSTQSFLINIGVFSFF